MVDFEIDNLIHAGVVFIVYLFVAIVLYFSLGGPVDAVLNGVWSSGNQTVAASYMDSYMPNIKWGVNVAFALGIAFPVTWFIFWVFSRDPFQGMVPR